MNKNYTKLFEPFTFPNGASVNNRIVMAPMTTQSSFENGMVTTDEHNYYKRRTNGVGLVITSCAHVMDNGRFPGSLSAASDDHIPSLTKLADTIKASGSKAILQIFHVGRMGTSSSIGGEQLVSASPVPALRDDAEKPRELTKEEVSEMVKAFGQAARRAILAGFDGVEIHGANTYLIQQFFSPHSNRRTDEWGGSLSNRMRFPLEVTREVKETIEKYAKNPFIFGYRISPEEIEEPGITLEQTLQLLTALEENLDYIHISLGHFMQSSLRDKEDSTPVIQTIKRHLGEDIPLITVGQIKTPDEAIKALDTGVPLVALGRALLVEADWIEKVSNGDESLIRTEIKTNDWDDLTLPDAMWEYVQSRPGWLPFSTLD
ncbi:NADH-dependent flavin oxidoreductase [Terribacillus saccharophilus]|uniref:NADH-dependent flavin oxidoreductase n=1 Tax=Terribacillus saccharophilus TaxID=361277 RepID=UPI000BA682F1|nr:NADH-dependent flavin oxidoreductase [Terribacillus saccharophilus]PAF15747.1 NADH-dependent flavin oxidoreductase [Terribacillus saccharophilus]